LDDGPTQLDSLATATGLQVFEHDDGFPEGVYGALVKHSAISFCIMVSSRCPTPGHRRFTLAHELGHFVLPEHVDVLLGTTPVHFSRGGHFRGRKEWWEVEADAFAAELLVPTILAGSRLRAAPRGIAAIQMLVRHFDVSFSCAAVRYAALTHEPVMIVLSCAGVVEWTCCAKCVWDHRWSRGLGRGDWAPRQSATAIFARSPALVASGEARTMSDVLPSWVEGAPPVPVIEEAVGLGAYGRVLTVLSCDHLPTPEEHEERLRRQEAGPRNWREGLREWSWDDPDDTES
jgi:hypothetical protein